jgi:polysaccharide biosynthesis protein VpsQ
LRFIRVLLFFTTVSYMILIWLQSSHFNPEVFYITILSSDPRLVLIVGGFLELLHLFEFGILYILIIHFLLTFGQLTYSKELTAIILSFLYSVSDEIHQYFVPFRSLSAVDVIKNIIGILIMWILIRYLYKRRIIVKRNIPTKRNQ